MKKKFIKSYLIFINNYLMHNNSKSLYKFGLIYFIKKYFIYIYKFLFNFKKFTYFKVNFYKLNSVLKNNILIKKKFINNFFFNYFFLCNSSIFQTIFKKLRFYFDSVIKKEKYKKLQNFFYKKFNFKSNVLKKELLINDESGGNVSISLYEKFKKFKAYFSKISLKNLWKLSRKLNNNTVYGGSFIGLNSYFFLRLDFLLVLIGFCFSLYDARSKIICGHFFINKKIVRNFNYVIKPFDMVSFVDLEIAKKFKLNFLFKLYKLDFSKRYYFLKIPKFIEIDFKIPCFIYLPVFKSKIYKKFFSNIFFGSGKFEIIRF